MTLFTSVIWLALWSGADLGLSWVTGAVLAYGAGAVFAGHVAERETRDCFLTWAAAVFWPLAALVWVGRNLKEIPEGEGKKKETGPVSCVRREDMGWTSDIWSDVSCERRPKLWRD